MKATATIYALLIAALVCPSPALAWEQIDLDVGGNTAARVDAPAWYLKAMSWPEVDIPSAAWVSVHQRTIDVPASSFDSTFGRWAPSPEIPGVNTVRIRPLGAVALTATDYYASVVFVVGKITAVNQTPLSTSVTSWCLSDANNQWPVSLTTATRFSSGLTSVYSNATYPNTGKFLTNGPYTYLGSTDSLTPGVTDLVTYPQMYRVMGSYVMAWRPKAGGGVEGAVWHAGVASNGHGVRNGSTCATETMSSNTVSDFRQNWHLITQIQGIRNSSSLFVRATGTNRAALTYHDLVDGVAWRTTVPAEVNKIFAAVAAGEGPQHPGASSDEPNPDPYALPEGPGWSEETSLTLPGLDAGDDYGEWGEWAMGFLERLVTPIYDIGDKLFWWLRAIADWKQES